MALGFPFGFRVAANQPLDSKYGPYNSIANAVASVVAGERYAGLTVNVNGMEYWWKDAVDDASLVQKTASSISVVQFDATQANLNLDFGGKSEVIFTASAPVNGNRSWQLVNNASASRMTIFFTIAVPGNYSQVFPSNFKMNNPEWDKTTKAWTAYQAGDYIATATYDGSSWWMDISGVYN
jgi:hypothetical protein